MLHRFPPRGELTSERKQGLGQSHKIFSVQIRYAEPGSWLVSSREPVAILPPVGPSSGRLSRRCDKGDMGRFSPFTSHLLAPETLGTQLGCLGISEAFNHTTQ